MMISTGIKKLDNILGGGIRDSIITDIVGKRGTGKTQLAMQISLSALRNIGDILFQDSTGEFRPERMLEIIKSQNLDQNLLDRVKIARLTNTSEQIQQLSKIKKNKDYSLVVIDNITDLFSFEYSKENQMLEKNISFMNYMHDLSLIAIQNKIPIIVTNNIRKIDDIEIETMKKSISFFTHVKIKLIKNGTKYSGQVSYLEKKSSFDYLISSSGLTDLS